MRYVSMRGHGGPEVLELGEMARPAPGPGDVLIRVAGAGVNRPDLSQRNGHYPPPAGASPVLGLEISGHIEALGPPSPRKDTGRSRSGSPSFHAKQWRLGDQVCALVSGGGYAEYCVAPAANCLPVSEELLKHLSLAETATLPETLMTVWANLFATAPYQVAPGRVLAGERLLVQGGSSGIGTMAIQVAKWAGVRVAVTAGTEEKCRRCVELGAEAAFNYREDWEAAARAWAGETGLNVILDMVGGAYTPKHLRLLAPGGRLVQISTLGGAEAQVDLRTIMTKRLIVTGSTLRPRSAEQKAALVAEVAEKIWPQIVAGKVRPVIAARFSLEQAAQAHRLLEEGQVTGKVLLTVGH